MAFYTKSIEELVKKFTRLPGIGSRTAERMAFYLLNASPEETKGLAQAILKLIESIRYCTICNNVSDNETCFICANPRRDKTIVCVVEDPKDITAIEKTGSYHGVYHVLHGAISPLEGVGPEKLKIPSLLDRIKRGGIKEVVIATDSDTEGEVTALHLSKLLQPSGVKMTRIAYGLPVGSDLDYADGATLVKALEGRREL